MAKKVIYISWVKLTDKYADDYFIQHLIRSGVEVEYWDIVAFTREQHSEVGELNVNYLRVLKSFGEFENLVKLNQNENVIYVTLMEFQWEVRSIYRLLSKYNCKTVFISWGEMPRTPGPVVTRAVIKLLRQPLKFVRIVFDAIFDTICKKLALIEPYDLNFTAGSSL